MGLISKKELKCLDQFLRPFYPVKVNCWFCSTDAVVPYGNKNCWDCPACQQYNGFNEVSTRRHSNFYEFCVIFAFFTLTKLILLSDVYRMEITTSLFRPSTMEIWTILCPVHRAIISAIMMSCVRIVPETSFWKPSNWQHLYLWMRLDSILYGFSCANTGPLILVLWIENF